ncbi:MAG TPA: hypothetical protein PL045_12565, partial [Chitinophagaceae bacterium]|nr:hypothetical protein [Chitinophagaceae bacterium]
FKVNRSGMLKEISIYSEMVIGEPLATISLFEFDADTKEWKEKVSESSVGLSQQSAKQWIPFPMQSVLVEPGKYYAFKIECNEQGIMAVGECGWKEDPYKDGMQWLGNSENPEGAFHSRFDLSFAVTVEAA